MTHTEDTFKEGYNPALSVNFGAQGELYILLKAFSRRRPFRKDSNYLTKVSLGAAPSRSRLNRTRRTKEAWCNPLLLFYSFEKRERLAAAPAAEDNNKLDDDVGVGVGRTALIRN